MLVGEFYDSRLYFGDGFLTAQSDLGDEGADLDHFILLEAAGGDGGGVFRYSLTILTVLILWFSRRPCTIFLRRVISP